MPGHEHYEELCALAATGQVPEDEAAEFNRHYQVCDICKGTHGDYAMILAQFAAVKAPTPSSNMEVILQARREEFIQRSRQSGIVFTEEAVRAEKQARRTHGRSWWPWREPGFVVSAVAIVTVMVCALCVRVAEKHQRPDQQAALAPVSNSARLDTLNPQPTVVSVTQETAKKSRESDRELEALREMLQRIDVERDQAVREASDLRNRVTDLSNWVETTQHEGEDAKEHLARLRSENSGLLAALVEKEDTIQALTYEMKVQATVAEREKELNGAAKDVRELMSARNLHIIDVADVDRHGKAKKSFGRVFYIEGQSLLFYAFDLGEAAASSRILFQAWGQKEGARDKPKNLGVFRVDDQAQRRWVLRVDDPKVLAAIDSLFVTVESVPGVDEPTGRRLIYAYLDTPANHP